MKYHVIISSNDELMRFYVDSENRGLSATVTMLIALYEKSGSPKLITISIFPQVNEKVTVTGE